MKTNRNSANNQPLMASALLATAFVITRTRTRAMAARPSQLPSPEVMGEGHLTHRGRRGSLAATIDRWLAHWFHCALPNGLEQQDFDLTDLT